MKLRPIHLVRLLLLLATLQVAEAAPIGNHALQGRYAELYHAYAAVFTEAAQPCGAPSFTRHAPASTSSRTESVWTMRPPAAHCVALQSFTGFARRA